MSQLADRITLVIENPGAVVPRDDAETDAQHTARAVLTHLGELADEVHGRFGALELGLLLLAIFVAGAAFGRVFL